MPKEERTVIQKRGDNIAVAFQAHESDTPHLPVQDFKELERIYPEAIPWILTQMEKEADFRRKETRRCNTFIFMERSFGQLFGCFIGMSGVIGGAYTATHGSSWAGGIIATAAISTLAVAFLGKFRSLKTKETLERAVKK